MKFIRKTSSMPILNYIQLLRHIYLHNNRIKNVPTHLIYKSPKLLSIDLEENELETVEVAGFSNSKPSKNINLIDMSQNEGFDRPGFTGELNRVSRPVKRFEIYEKNYF